MASPSTTFVSVFPADTDDANLQYERGTTSDPYKLQGRDYNRHDVQIRQLQSVIGTGDPTGTILSLVDIAVADASAASVNSEWDVVVGTGTAYQYQSPKAAIDAGYKKIKVLAGEFNDRSEGAISLSSDVTIEGWGSQETAWFNDGLTVQDNSRLRQMRLGDGGSDCDVTVIGDHVEMFDVGIYSQNTQLAISGGSNFKGECLTLWSTSTYPSYTAVENVDNILLAASGVADIHLNRVDFMHEHSVSANPGDAAGIKVKTSVNNLFLDGATTSATATDGSGNGKIVFVALGDGSSSSHYIEDVKLQNINIDNGIIYAPVVVTPVYQIDGLTIDGVYSRNPGTYASNILNSNGGGPSGSLRDVDIRNIFCNVDSIVQLPSCAWENINIQNVKVLGDTVPTSTNKLFGQVSGSGKSRGLTISDVIWPRTRPCIIDVDKSDASDTEDIILSNISSLRNIHIQCNGGSLKRVKLSNLHLFTNGASVTYVLLLASANGTEWISGSNLQIHDNATGSTNSIYLQSASGDVNYAVFSGVVLNSSQSSGNLLEISASDSGNGHIGDLQYKKEAGATLNSGFNLGSSHNIS